MDDVITSGARCKILICGGRAAAAVEAAINVSTTEDVNDKWRGDAAKILNDFILAMEAKLGETFEEDSGLE